MLRKTRGLLPKRLLRKSKLAHFSMYGRRDGFGTGACLLTPSDVSGCSGLLQ